MDNFWSAFTLGACAGVSGLVMLVFIIGVWSSLRRPPQNKIEDRLREWDRVIKTLNTLKKDHEDRK